MPLVLVERSIWELFENYLRVSWAFWNIVSRFLSLFCIVSWDGKLRNFPSPTSPAETETSNRTKFDDPVEYLVCIWVALEPSTLSLYHAPGHRKLLEWQGYTKVQSSVGQICLGLPKGSAAQGFTFGQGSTFVSQSASEKVLWRVSPTVLYICLPLLFWGQSCMSCWHVSPIHLRCAELSTHHVVAVGVFFGVLFCLNHHKTII